MTTTPSKPILSVKVMNSPSANLKVASFDQIVCIKVSGRANFTCSLDLKKLVDELWSRGIDRFMFDLSECLLMDSTFLGVLSGIGVRFAELRGPGDRHMIELVNPNPRIAEVLENLGIAHLFFICSENTPVSERFQPVEHEEAARVDVTRTCLEAHRMLIEINPNNERKFKDVNQFLLDDLKRQESEKN